MVRCGVCHYVSPSDVKGHTARTCPIRQVECRRSLPVGHPFKEAGQCVRGNCIHLQTCTSCGGVGHLLGTQRLSTTRYKLNDAGKVVRKQNKKELNIGDFVCTKITAVAVKNLVANSNNASTAADALKVKRRATVSRLRGNIASACIDVDDTMDMMEELGSDAALLQKENKSAFKALVKNAHLGAVEAGKRAAEAAESDVECDEVVYEDIDKNSLGGDHVSADEGKSGKAAQEKTGQRVFLGASARRIDKYAVSVMKGKLASKESPRKLFMSGAQSAKKAIKASTGPVPAAEPRSSSSAGSGSVSSDLLSLGVGVNVEDRWPSGTRAAFSDTLPMFTSPVFGAFTPLQIAHFVLEKATQRPMVHIDMELSGFVIKAAVDRHMRGYTLISGTLSAAHVAEWLCSLMPAAMQTSKLSCIAQAIRSILLHFRELGTPLVGPGAEQAAK